MPNPMDSYRDIYDWPYAWSTDFAGPVVSWIPYLEDQFFCLDLWTYRNHWRHTAIHPPDTPEGFTIDIYQGCDQYDRSQLPIVRGDEISDWIISEWSRAVGALIWNHYYWTPAFEWTEWPGFQGDFVDHVHVEFDPIYLREELILRGGGA